MMFKMEHPEMKMDPKQLMAMAHKFWDIDEDHNMTAADLLVFFAIATRPEGVTMREILTSFPKLDKSTLSNIADKFHDDFAWVKREDDDEDRRRKRLTLTPAGKKVLDKLIN